MDQAVVFGSHQNLVGTVAVASDRESAQCDRNVAVLMLTPGMLHHAGPFRMHVDLARQLTRSGLMSLRFDLSGIGESLGVGAGGRSIDRAANETSQAMDFVQQQYGCDRFILFGLCSGADDSVHTAVKDERVIGLATLDGCGYRTRRYHWNRIWNFYAPRMWQPIMWKRLANRFRSASADEVPASLQMGTDVREFPGRDQAAREFQTLVDRNVRMHFAYTGGIRDYYNHAEQFFDMFSDVQWSGQATTSYFPKMDHVAMLYKDRQQIVNDLAVHIKQIAIKQIAGAKA